MNAEASWVQVGSFGLLPSSEDCPYCRRALDHCSVGESYWYVWQNESGRLTNHKSCSCCRHKVTHP